MELVQYWKIIQKNIWLILALAVLGLASGILYTFVQPPVYQSSSTLLLNPAVPSELVPYVQTQYASNVADSYTQLLQTRSFAQSVAKELSFPISIDKISESISTKLETNTLFYHITVQAATAEQAQQLLSAVLTVFLSANGNQQTTTNGDTTADVSKSLNEQLKSLDDRITYYNQQITTLESQPTSSDRETQLFDLQGRLDSLQKSKTDTLVALAQVGKNNQVSNSAIVVDQPLLGVRLSNNMIRNIGLALVTALLIGVGLAFLRDYLDYTVHSPDELKSLLNKPLMAAVGVVGGATIKRRAYGRNAKHSSNPAAQGPELLRGHNLITIEHPKSPEAESFRVLRTNMQFSGLTTPIKSLVVTSASPGEGKSFVSANLAVTMAQSGKRVILVDADLRKPSVHKTFGLPNISGFTNLLLNDVNGNATALQKVPGIDNLVVITSGPIPPNPSEILNSPAAIALMAKLGGLVDMVIYDAPPAGAVTDPLILSSRADATLLVINAGHTRKDAIVRVKEALEHVTTHPILTVLNRVNSADMQGYYYYQYYGYYGQDTVETPTPGKGNGAGNGNGNGHKAYSNGKATASAVTATILNVAPNPRNPDKLSSEDH